MASLPEFHSFHAPAPSSSPIEIGLLAPLIDHRLHLFGVAQEIRDLIYEEVFDHDLTRSGAQHLQPLLTCRKFYHEFHARAWFTAVFNLTVFSGDKFEILPTRIPPETAERLVGTLFVLSTQIPLLKGHVLPKAHSVIIPDKGDPDAWFETIFHCCLSFNRRALGVYAPMDIFAETVITHLRSHLVLWALHAVEEDFEGKEKTTSRYVFKHVRSNPQTPEHYMLQIISVRESRAHIGYTINIMNSGTEGMDKDAFRDTRTRAEQHNDSLDTNGQDNGAESCDDEESIAGDNEAEDSEGASPSNLESTSEG